VTKQLQAIQFACPKGNWLSLTPKEQQEWGSNYEKLPANAKSQILKLIMNFRIDIGDIDQLFPNNQPYPTISSLYEEIRAAFKRMGPSVFLGEESSQIGGYFVNAVPKYGMMGQILTVEDAVNAINEIIEQGEGADISHENSHYSKFTKMLEEMELGNWWKIAVKNVASNPALAIRADTICSKDEVFLITKEYPFTFYVMELFNASYALTVQIMLRLWGGADTSTANTTGWYKLFPAMMKLLIAPIATVLTLLPAGRDAKGNELFGGPSFEYIANMQLLAHEKAAVALLGERFDVLKKAIDEFVAILQKLIPHFDQKWIVKTFTASVGPPKAVETDEQLSFEPLRALGPTKVIEIYDQFVTIQGNINALVLDFQNLME